MRPLFTMTRLEEAYGRGTISAMQVNGELVCWMLENVDLLNQPDLSSIPAQQYVIRWTKSPKFGRYTWEMIDIPGRTGVRIHHGGNIATAEDTLGCPLPGMKLVKGGLELSREAELLLAPGSAYVPAGAQEAILSIRELY